MKKNLSVLTTPWFLIALFVLILNDLFLKSAFGNFFTGKLSDFAGLFVFAVFWTAFFPKHKKIIVVATAILFIIWKSPYSQGFIDIWNSMGLISISRVVDFSDLIALIVLLPVWALNMNPAEKYTLKVHPVFPLLFSLFAFAATSYQKNFDYDKTYEFDCSINELVNRINWMNLNNQVQNHPLSLHYENANYKKTMYGDTAWYYKSGDYDYFDTIYKKNSTEIDTIYHHRIPITDTVYVNPDGIFFISFHVKPYMNEKGVTYCHNVPVKLKIEGSRSRTELTLKTIYTSNCLGMFEKEAQKKEEHLLLEAFEKDFIEKLKQ